MAFCTPRGVRIPVLDIPVVDTVAVVALAAAVTWVTGLNFWLTLVVLFVTGGLAHKFLCAPVVKPTCNCMA
jgi:hypothetical protein